MPGIQEALNKLAQPSASASSASTDLINHRLKIFAENLGRFQKAKLEYAVYQQLFT